MEKAKDYNYGLDQSTREKIIRIIKALIPDAKIYLFGSRARGTFGERSDIDIALDVAKKLTISELGELKDVLNATHISYKVDVVDLNNLPEEIYASVKKELVLWKD